MMEPYPRLNRLFGPTGRLLVVAMDHGIFGEPGFLRGLEDFPQVLRALVQAGPDALQLTPGQAPLLQGLPRPKPALILRLDTTNAYQALYGRSPGALFAEASEATLETALRLDAAAVVVNLLWKEGEVDLYRDTLRAILRLKPLSERYGLPLMVEPLVLKPGYEVDGRPEVLAPLVRQAVELGADLLKVDFTEPLEAFHQVVEAAAGRPVLARGGGKVEEATLLNRTQLVLKQGARGVVYGRNVFQHPDPSRLVRTLMALLHGGDHVEGTPG